MDTEQFVSETLRSEFKADVIGNGSIYLEMRTPGAIVVHTMTKDEAISLMEWLSIATL